MTSIDLGVILSGFISGVFASMGVGGNGILIVYLTLFGGYSQKASQGIGVFFFIPVAVMSTFLYSRKKMIDWKVVLPYAFLGVLGTFGGFFVSVFFDHVVLCKIFGLMFVATGLVQLFKKH